jgi:hypothetical protein
MSLRKTDENSALAPKPLSKCEAKLKLACDLILNFRQNRKKDPNDYTKFTEGLNIFNALCMDRSLPNDELLNILIKFFELIPDQGLDMLTRWRDMIPHLRGKTQEKHIELLTNVAKCNDIDIQQRLMTSVCLYNQCWLSESYECFEIIALDNKAPINYRVEACRFLFCDEQNEERKEIAQSSLIDFIERDSMSSKSRYEIIAGFISKTGISCIMNSSKLIIPYDEDFVCGLQTVFFYHEYDEAVYGKQSETEHLESIKYKILSAQHMLDMKCNQENIEEKTKIGEILLRYALNAELPEKIRSDACDVLHRLGITEHSKRAREIISELGGNVIDNKGNIEARSFNIYTDKQNVHNENVDKRVQLFIEKIIQETDEIRIRPYKEVFEEVQAMVKSKNLSPDDRMAIHQSLDRVNLDTARFTKYKATIAEIFVHVWLRIINKNSDTRAYLETRLVEELIDMEGWCSTGYASRFVNVLSDTEGDMKIGWNDQIQANISGRINAFIRDETDEDRQSGIVTGMMNDAPDEDKKIYQEFIKDALEVIKNEMETEFVKGGYLSKKDFNLLFIEGSKKWNV